MKDQPRKAYARLTAIKFIADMMQPEDILVSSCGKISRDLYSVNDRPLNFYNLGAMGSTIPLSIGIALTTERGVMALVGDGEALIDLSTLVLLKSLRLNNLAVAILDNQSFNSTGGQPTISKFVDFESIGYRCVRFNIPKDEDCNSPRIPLTHEQIKERFLNAL